jgi:predicted TIM-barrel fold metal-dependent hydrolase
MILSLLLTRFNHLDSMILKENLRQLVAVDPHRLVFGTDLPSTRARIPYNENHDVGLLLDALGIEVAQKVLHSNALNLYKIHQ